MTINNKQELIDLIKEKQASAKRDLEKLPRRITINSEKLVSTIRAYEYVIDLIDSAKIVVYPEEMGIEPCEPALKHIEEDKQIDRFREFEFGGAKYFVDAKEIVCIKRYEDGDIEMRLQRNTVLVNEKRYDCNDIFTWWKYWKNK